MNQEVSQPILNSPFDAPVRHWYIREGEQPEMRDGRRPAIVYPPREERKDRRIPWNLTDGTLAPSSDYSPGLELTLVNLIRERVAAWRKAGYAGVTRTTHDLLTWWRREGREKRLFFAQVEAAETIIFLNEARADFRQGINVPRDEPSEDRRADGYAGFLRYACKMATGSGKTTVMGMLAAWSILNKVNNRGDARFSDVVLIVCPNVTIRNRLQELDPLNGEASLYRTRDLVPPHLMAQLSQGRVLVTNWHVFAPQTPGNGESARVVKAGVAVTKPETIQFGAKSTTARGSRYLTLDDYQRQVAAGLLRVIEEERDREGTLKKVRVESTRYVESDTSLLNRVIGKEVGGKQNILVMNDEAHHAYRIKRAEADEDEDEEEDVFGEEEFAEDYFQEATVWIDGLDKIHKQRGINFCVDLSATPYFLGRVGQETNRPFPWVVSDFGLVDAIESGLVKIPQLAVRDTTGAAIPGYFNVWHWILPQLTSAERGGKRSDPKPEAILKYADHPIRMLGGLWEELRQQLANKNDDPRPPVFILVCKNTKLAKVMYDWLADDVRPTNIPPAKLDGFRNRDDAVHTIRVDSKVVFETDTDGAKNDEQRWMRFTLDTVGKLNWPRDRQGRELYPDNFEELAKKLERPLHPPGRDVRCIVSVAMLTEGWDCNTVTHVVGLRPFLSQLLCEQVVGRALRRFNYEVDESTGLLTEEVAKVFGVPFEIIPMKANPQGPVAPPPHRRHVHAVPEKSQFEIHFPRVEGYTQAVRNRIAVDWSQVPPLNLLPNSIPPEVEVKGLNVNNVGRLSLAGPGKLDDVRLQTFRDQHRLQELVFDLAGALTREYLALNTCECPAHVLFPQLAAVVQRFVEKKVVAYPPTDKKDLFLAPYYGWAVERLRDAIRPDASAGEIPEVPLYEAHRGPGSTSDVDFWTSRDVREVRKSHLNYIVADTKKWEQSAAFYLDKSEHVVAFVKNAGLGFAIPYFHNGQPHEYIPDFIARLAGTMSRHLILEVKGWDPLEDIKVAAIRRWIDAVNADGQYGQWHYELVKKPDVIPELLRSLAEGHG